MKRYLKIQFVRYLISGTTAALTQLVVTFVLTEGLGLYYLSSACLGFVGAFIVSFLLQKFWTFEDMSHENVSVQVPLSLTIALVGLALNTLLLYILVEYFHLWYIFSQFISMGLISTSNYFVYKAWVFRPSEQVIQ
jgi:putative flippase GtrA